jgi:SAM-dependent methyltransferase
MSSDPAQSFPANPDQATYWHTRGEQWVANQASIDARLVAVTQALFARAAASPGERALDIGCGTGTTTIELAAQVGASGAVLAADISAPMLAVARQRCAERGYRHVRLLHADAQSHAFETGAFDLLLSRFGVMFFSDPVAAFANLIGALRPGGRLAFVCWAPLDDNPWFKEPLAAGVRRLGPPEPQPPRAPGPLALAETGYVEEILDAAGFAEVRIETTTIPLAGAATADEEAAFAALLGPLSRLIQTQEPDPATRQAIIEDVAERFRPYQGEAGVRIPASLHYVTARRP